jgi:hypothetical protein
MRAAADEPTHVCFARKLGVRQTGSFKFFIVEAHN